MFGNKNTSYYMISNLLYLTDLSKATGLSATLIRLDPPQIEFKWSYEVKDALEPQRFEVLAQPDHNSSATPITILSIPIGSRSKCLTILKHTTYTLTVTTTYGKNTRIESEAIQFKGPEENEGLCVTIFVIKELSQRKDCRQLQ